MINSWCKIIDVGGESTRPGSKIVSPKMSGKELKFIVKNFKKKYKKMFIF